MVAASCYRPDAGRGSYQSCCYHQLSSISLGVAAAEITDPRLEGALSSLIPFSHVPVSSGVIKQSIFMGLSPLIEHCLLYIWLLFRFKNISQQ